MYHIFCERRHFEIVKLVVLESRDCEAKINTTSTEGLGIEFKKQFGNCASRPATCLWS